MDEAQLKQILQDYKAPAADENAKKRAINLALAEFDTVEKQEENNSQGISLLGRLIGSSNKQQRRTPMSRRLVYGGMATAMAVIFATSIVYESMTTTIGSAGSGNNFSNIANNVSGSSISIPSIPNPFSAEKKKGSGNESVQALSEVQYNIMDGGYPTESQAMASSAMPVPTAPPMASMMAKGSMEMRGIMASDAIIDPGYYKDVGRDKFEDFEENQIKDVKAEPVSTFSIDVDTASYSFVRRQLNAGVLPQKDAVRVEEMINYFDYNYPLPETKEQPFQSTVTVVPSPWKNGSKLMHIAIKGYDIDKDTQPRSNLVFLLDVSGSMNSPDKLPLVVNSLKMLLDTLKPDDTVGIVVYAGAAGTVLEPTKVSEKEKILSALERLSAGGGTAGAEGIRQAYQLAESNFDKDAVNRVILATDGDFNVGITNQEELKDFVERKRKSGVFLSVLGFGQGNLNDSMMQELAQNGNGVAAYIDNLNEARKVLVEEATSTLFPIAKDVKIQVEFNPATVAEYRLVGYETRHLNREDFNNDAVDAGDIGAGHTVTAIYEITPVGAPRAVDESRYAPAAEQARANTDFGGEYAFLKIRYKLPNEDVSKLITTPISDVNAEMTAQHKSDVDFSTAVASFGQLLKGGKYTGTMGYDDVINMAQESKGADEFGYRSEFIQLVRLAKSAAALQKN